MGKRCMGAGNAPTMAAEATAANRWRSMLLRRRGTTAVDAEACEMRGAGRFESCRGPASSPSLRPRFRALLGRRASAVI